MTTLLTSIISPSSVATLNGTQTLTNKTLTSAVLLGTLTAGGNVGTAGQVLTSTGTGVQWTTVTSSGGSTLPSQTGNAGKYLTTDGTNLSWGAVSGGSGFAYVDAGLITDPINTSALVDGGTIV
jgi:hypothetical protein